ncbi:hypothetical protein QUF72_09805, partial [Desulfobacterales bacterium HSG2]|nr:hypothetical protein [Desulfobacterales bacterium HSG2]
WIPAFAGMTARGKWIPASAGMTAIEHPRCHSCGSRNPLSDFQQWIPAFAGMTARGKWIPASAGMTAIEPPLSFLRKQESTLRLSNNGFPRSRE